MVIYTKFIPPVSVPKLEVKVHKEEILATRRIRVDLSDTKPKQSAHPVGKNNISGVLSQATKNKTYTPKNICSSASKDRSHREYLA